MKKIIALSKVFVTIFLRNRGNLFFILFFNTFMIIIFGLLQGDFYNFDFKSGVYFEKEIYEQYQKINEKYNFIVFDDEALLIEAVAKGEIVTGVIIKELDNESHKIITSKYNKDKIKYIEPVVNLLLTQLKQEHILKIESKIETVKSLPLNGFDFVFPGLLVFAIMQIGLAGGLTLLNMKNGESLKRLKTTPLSKIEFLISFSLSYFILILIQSAINIFVGIVVFGYKFEGSLLFIILVLSISSFSFIFLGISISNFSSNIDIGININRILTFPAAFFCNVFFPPNILPEVIQKIAYIHPLTCYVNITREICNGGSILNSSVLNIEFIAMCIILVISFLLTMRFFKWEERLA